MSYLCAAKRTPQQRQRWMDGTDEKDGKFGYSSASFVAAVAEWVVASYFRAFEAMERELVELDSKVMSDVPTSVSDELARLVELRRSIGTLRAALSPHREIVVSLAHPELDLLFRLRPCVASLRLRSKRDERDRNDESSG